MWLPWPKATLLIASGPPHDPDRKHLFVVLTQGLGEKSEYLLACFQSINGALVQDLSCVISSGEHPFVKHETFVRFDQCRKVAQEDLMRAVKEGKMVPHGSVSDEVFQRICAGLKVSLHAPPWAKSMLAWSENL